MSAFTEANRKAFDELSATYDSKPWQHDLANLVKESLQARKDWIGAEWLDPSEPHGTRDVKLLDFASGTGNASNALGPFVNTIRGIDISPNMVDLYNTTAQKSGAYAKAVQGDLFAKEGVPSQFQTEEFSNFDIAVVALGFHHFEDPALALTRLAERLKGITGVLVIVDFLPFSPPPSAPNAPIKTHGFTPEQMRDLYTAAGFTDFDIVAVKKPAVMEMKDGARVERTLFVAKGRKAGSAWQKFMGWLGATQDLVGQQMSVERSRDEGRTGRWNPGTGKGTGESELMRAEGWDMVEGHKVTGLEGEEKKPWNMGL